MTTNVFDPKNINILFWYYPFSFNGFYARNINKFNPPPPTNHIGIFIFVDQKTNNLKFVRVIP